jgi:branched-chain amino acid transport system ATP-binding protein
MLRAENLHVKVSGIEILRGVSLEVNRGEIVGLVGANGTGKTTTLKTIMGFYKPDPGKVYVDNVDLTKLEPHKRVKYGIAYMPEDLRIFPWLTVAENIKVASLLAGRKDDLNDIMEEIYKVLPEIKRFINRQGFYLSGGEKRMVALARVLAVKPRYTLLDELFEGLAPALVERLMKALREMANEGLGILIAESNVILASKLCTKIYVIERGEIIAHGDPEEILNKIRF